MKIPPWQSLGGNARFLRRGVNLWPTFLGAGIRVERISDDFREFEVRLRLRPWTRNYVGTAFGGSLFSMCDPWWMIGTMRGLGRDYVVWDQAAAIEFLAPGRGDVTTRIVITDEHLAGIRAATADGQKHLVWCENDIVAADGTVVARNRKQLYVRRKPRGGVRLGRRTGGDQLPPA